MAVLAIDHFRSHGKVIFLVPTRPLVLQQAGYVRKHCASPTTVTELQGAQTDHLGCADWQDIVRSSDVLVGTAEVFRRALVDTKFLSLRDFSLLIFDECHNATGNSPMAAVMRDAVHRCAAREAPRILGLTASFAHGSLAGIEKKRKTLEGLLTARLFCPDVEERPIEFVRVAYNQIVLRPEMEQLVESKVKALLGLAEQSGIHIKESKSVIRRGVHVFTELGMRSFIYFLRECVAPQIKRHLEQRIEVLPHGPQRDGARRAIENIPRLRQAMHVAAEQLAADGSLTNLPSVTDKALRLLELIQGLPAGTRVIVFCEQTVLAYPLAHLLEHQMGVGSAGTCTGVGSMTDGQRKLALEQFRNGVIPLLTCTAALEEGLDVSECQVVVRFSQFQTTKSHIQGSGRARAWNARVFYFDNEPGKELAGAALMDMTAKASSLSLSDAELQAKRAHTDVEGVHPYLTVFGAEISIFNCVQLVYEYTARTMCANFRPEDAILSYSEDARPKTLVAAHIPSPQGFFEVQADTVNLWWGDIGLDDVAEQPRMQNWETSDRELRRFMYVVAVKLSKRGLLDCFNQPSACALRETRRACEEHADWRSPGARIGVKYDPKGLQIATADGVADVGAAAAAVGAPAPKRRAENHKGHLNEVTIGKGGASYTTVPEAEGFRSTVRLADGRSFRGAGTAPAQTKKAAEQLAAEAALQALGEHPLAAAAAPALTRPPIANGIAHLEVVRGEYTRDST